MMCKCVSSLFSYTYFQTAQGQHPLTVPSPSRRPFGEDSPDLMTRAKRELMDSEAFFLAFLETAGAIGDAEVDGTRGRTKGVSENSAPQVEQRRR